MHALYKLLLFQVLACLGQNALAGKIINGEKAPEGSMLYMASLQNSRNDHLCGGFLIREDFVVSAAHCNCGNPTHVVLATHNLKTGNGKKWNIEKKYIRQSYSRPGNGEDIMLLKLSENVQLDNNIETIPLPTSGTSVRANDECSVAGWGAQITGGSAVDDLTVVKVSVIEPSICRKEWNKLPLPDNVTCAGGYDTNKGFCQGDSGGPLVCKGIAVGIVSFNHASNCHYPNKPNVYTDVAKYIPWINSILKGTKHYE